MSHKLKYATRPLRFSNLYHLVDCLMLFGASIEKMPDGCRLRIIKSKRRWAQLGWAAIVAEAQDPSFEFLRFRITAQGANRVVFSTGSSRFLEAAWGRWYGKGGGSIKRMPADIELDDKAMLFWLLGHWGLRTPILPRMGRFSPPDGPGVWKRSNHHESVFILTEHREAVNKWLQERVPERIWRDA